MQPVPSVAKASLPPSQSLACSCPFHAGRLTLSGAFLFSHSGWSVRHLSDSHRRSLRRSGAPSPAEAAAPRRGYNTSHDFRVLPATWAWGRRGWIWVGVRSHVSDIFDRRRPELGGARPGRPRSDVSGRRCSQLEMCASSSGAPRGARSLASGRTAVGAPPCRS